MAASTCLKGRSFRPRGRACAPPRRCRPAATAPEETIIGWTPAARSAATCSTRSASRARLSPSAPAVSVLVPNLSTGRRQWHGGDMMHPLFLFLDTDTLRPNRGNQTVPLPPCIPGSTFHRRRDLSRPLARPQRDDRGSAAGERRAVRAALGRGRDDRLHSRYQPCTIRLVNAILHGRTDQLPSTPDEGSDQIGAPADIEYRIRQRHSPGKRGTSLLGGQRVPRHEKRNAQREMIGEVESANLLAIAKGGCYTAQGCRRHIVGVSFEGGRQAQHTVTRLLVAAGERCRGEPGHQGGSAAAEPLADRYAALQRETRARQLTVGVVQ